jgi:DNA-binding protein Alba
MAEDIDLVYIGNKPLGSYLTACLWAINKVGSVTLLGRGSHIKATVDVAEILKRQIENFTETIKINSESFEGRNISTIEINIVKKIKKD